MNEHIRTCPAEHLSLAMSVIEAQKGKIQERDNAIGQLNTQLSTYDARYKRGGAFNNGAL